MTNQFFIDAVVFQVALALRAGQDGKQLVG